MRLRPKACGSTTYGYAIAILGSMCYGLNPLFGLPLFAEGLTALQILFYRYLGAMIFVSLSLTLRHQTICLTKKEAMSVGLMGVFFAASSILLFESFTIMDAGIASTILFTYPLFVALIMLCFFGERPKITTWLSLCLASVGLGLLYETDEGTLSAKGMLMVLGAALSYAVYLVGVGQSVLQKMPTLKLTFYAMLCGVLVFLLLMKGDIDIGIFRSTKVICNLLGLALFPTYISVLCITRAIHIIGSTPASIIGAMEPLTALAISILLFGGRLTMLNIVGVTLILTAVTLIVVRNA